MRTWIERHRNILDFTLSSLLRRKRKNAALVSVYTLIVFLLASVLLFTYALREEASILLKEAPEMIVQKLVAGRQELIPVAYMERIKNIRGVSSVKDRLWGYYYDPVVGANYTLMVAEDPDVARPVVVEHVDGVLEVLEVAALVGAHGDSVGVLLDRGSHDVGDAPVVPEVNDLGARALDQPAHDVDRGVVAVEERGGRDEAERRRPPGCVVLLVPDCDGGCAHGRRNSLVFTVSKLRGWSIVGR